MKNDKMTKTPLVKDLEKQRREISHVKEETELKKEKKIIIPSEKTFQHLIESCDEVIYRADPITLHATFVNRSIETLFGYTVEEWISSPQLFEQAIHPDDKEHIFKAVSEAHRNFDNISLEYRIVRKDGSLRWVQDNISWEHDHTGDIFSQVGVMYDITERKYIEDELKFRSGITEQVNAPVIATGLDFKINWVNQAFSSLYGYVADDVIGQTPDFLNIDPFSEEIQKDIYQTVSSGGVWTGEAMNRRKDGTRFSCEMNIFPLRDKNGNIFAYASHISDITERKKAALEQERLTAELKTKNKELEQLLYVTSHDLRSPLVNIAGYSKELDYSLKELMTSIENGHDPASIKEKLSPIVNEDIPESIHYIHASVLKMETLIRGILKLSRLGSSEKKMVEIDMNGMINDIVDNHRYRLNELKIQMEVSKLPNCMGDSLQINQLFSNLLDNAIKYSDSKRSCVINISGYTDKSQSVYCIEDNGIGIAPGHQDKIFEIFHQLEPKRIRGDGLGLTIANKIIEKHNGKIWVESELSKGSKFFVSLPS